MSKKNKKKHRSHGRPPAARVEAPAQLAEPNEGAAAAETAPEPADEQAEAAEASEMAGLPETAEDRGEETGAASAEASADEPVTDEPVADEPVADEPADGPDEHIADPPLVAETATLSTLDEPVVEEPVTDGPPLDATEPVDEQAVADAAPAEQVESPAASEGAAEPEVEEGSVLPPAQIRAALEALIFASPHPITPKEIARVLEGVRKEDWQRELDGLRADYSRDERGLQVIEVAGGYQITTRPEYNDWVRELLDPRTPTRLSIQALETLAVIAYKQPVTLPEIIELRGVKSGGVVKTLLEKRLIRITGRKEVVGRPILYGTTKQFLLHFGLKDLNELPKIEEFAEVLGEEVDVAGLKRAIESPLPVQVGLSDPDGEQIPLFEGATPPPAPPGEPAAPDGEAATGEEALGADDATGELFAPETGAGDGSPSEEPPGDPS